MRTSVIKVNVLKTVVFEGHYEKKGETKYHVRDLKNDDFYPLQITSDRLYLGTLFNYDSKQNLQQINSVYLGKDKIMVDDSYFGLNKKLLEFMNVKKVWKFYQDVAWYQIGESKPIIIFELQM